MNRDKAISDSTGRAPIEVFRRRPLTLTGLVLQGRYRLIQRLGRGGFAEVWLAHDLHLSCKSVAVKALRLDRSERAADVERFEFEPQILSRIRDVGGHVVDVTDFGEDHGLHFFVMEYIEGVTLRAELRRVHQFSCADALTLAIQLCDGISAAHAQRIAHRDLKPENIMLVQRRGGPHLRIVDLGIARIVSEHERRTQPSAQFGTPIYMAPEVVSAESIPPEGYFAADIYAVGVILYELLVGAPPFNGDAAHVIYKKVQSSPPDIRQHVSGISEEMAAIVMRCLDRRPERRFSSIDELAAALRQIFAGPLTTAVRGDDEMPTLRRERGSCGATFVNLAREGRIRLDLQAKGPATIYIRHIRAGQRGPHPLALSQVQGLIPAPLTGTYNSDTMSVRAEPTGTRAHLYRDASQPTTRLEHILLGRASTSQVFDVGHRRHQVRRIQASMLDASEDFPCIGHVGEERSIGLTSPPWPGYVFVLAARDDETNQHIECICLEPHR